MSQPSFCVPTETFPAVIDNRPTLPRIKYRIGAYTDFRQKLLSDLDQSVLLQGWSYRQADDPGIALLEGAAILGDILTFYQELYANEAWLRTATWPQSVTDLVRLTGYRPAPGLGGESTAAFEFKGATTVTVPAGFGLNAQIVGQTSPVDFETAEAFSAVPALSRMQLYSQFQTPDIVQGTTTFAFNTVDLVSTGLILKPKDRLALVDPTTLAGSLDVIWQIAVIQSVTVQADKTLIQLTGAWQSTGGPFKKVMAYKLGRSLHCNGYNAPQNQVTITSGVASTETVSTSIPFSTLFDAFPLDRVVPDLSTGGFVLADLQTQFTMQVVFVPDGWGGYYVPEITLSTPYLYMAQILSSTVGSDAVGPITSSVSFVDLSPVETPDMSLTGDRRLCLMHEVIDLGFSVQSAPAFYGDLGGNTSVLNHFGDGNSYQALNGRRLQFVELNPDDSVKRIEYSTATIDPTQIGSDLTAVALRSLTLAPPLVQFSQADFLPNSTNVAVFGNVVDITQGKTQPVATLGNGDARQINQSFKVPKAPLTWLSDEAATPPRDPELLVLVDQIAWTEVDSLFSSGPLDRHYIIRQDTKGDSWVQFGDGVNGAKLSSGFGNVTTLYRSGSGANGSRVPGTNPNQTSQAQNLSAIRLYDLVTLGTAPETSASARTAAPGRVQALGRLVTLSDYEYEALALPGVEKANATWDVADGAPTLVLNVLLANQAPSALASVAASMTTANISRGPQRFPVVVQGGALLYVYVQLSFGMLSGYQSANVIEAIGAALGVIPVAGTPPAGGLFSLDQRDFAESEYASRIQGVVQNVVGVSWVEVTAFDQLGSADDPSTLTVPTTPDCVDVVAATSQQILALYAGQFTATPAGGGS